ncbi:MAG: hypothetical protein HWQ43_16585 [Nostoc sp. JL31]|nr:hypothetical protein [Nostoc sp. JL31]MBN3890706.1 hypothetical protein [Nostoc sp. JL31]
MPQWAEIIPNVEKNILEQIVSNLENILVSINIYVKNTLRSVFEFVAGF